jgi:hypothetical protein
MKTTSNGNGNGDNAVRRLFPETANENLRGFVRHITSAMADRAHAAEHISFRVRNPMPLGDLLPPYQSFDSTARGFLQAIAADPMA